MAIKFDATTALKNNLMKVSNRVGDPMCIPIAAAYSLLVKQVNMIVTPAAFFKSQIVSAVDGFTTDVFKEVNGALNLLSSNIPQINLQIRLSSLNDANVFKKTCLDFNDILPNAMKSLIDSAITNTADGLYDLMGDMALDMPDEIVDMVEDTIDLFKSNALSDALSDVAKTLISPIDAYRAFIKSTGVLGMLKKLQKFEKCMSNPKNCNRPKKEFLFPNTKKYNSQYYMDLLAINLKGEIQMKKIVADTKGIERKLSKTMTNLDNFRKSPVVR